MPSTADKLINPKTYIASILGLGLLTIIAAVPQWGNAAPARFCVFFLIAAVGSSMKVHLPGVKGTMSVGFLFVLIAVMELSLPEVLAIASISIITQCLWHA